MHVLHTLDLHHAEHAQLLRERELARRAVARTGNGRTASGARGRYAALLPWARRSPRR